MSRIIFPNKKINLNYHVIDTYEAGISLKGNEVKSLVSGNGNIDESFGIISKNKEMFLLNMYIPPFQHDSKIDKLEPTRKRKLLLNKDEIKKIDYQIKKEKLTIIPTKVYFKNDKIKIELAIAKHKNIKDKRYDIKKRNDERISKKFS
jgi:SsrA-binding protein